MLRLLIMATLSLTPAFAQAGSVFLNGVNIDGVQNQTFKNCTVEIDAYGNVLITAKGYRVGGSAADKAPAVKPESVGRAPTRRYWLVTEKAAPGMSQYDVDVFVNAKWVRKLLSDERHIVLELTKYLKTGPNQIRLIAKKMYNGSRRSTSPQHYFRVVVGEGDSGGRQVMIRRKSIDYKRTASETQNFSDEYNITVY